MFSVLLGHYRVPESGRLNPALQISDEVREKMESDTKEKNLIDADKVAKDVTLASFFGISILYFITATASVLSVVFIFKFYRGELKGSIWQSLHVDSFHSASNNSKRDAVEYSTAIDLKNGFVQVCKQK